MSASPISASMPVYWHSEWDPVTLTFTAIPFQRMHIPWRGSWMLRMRGPIVDEWFKDFD